MKKLFISCPMRGLDEDYIRELREWMFQYACLIWQNEDFEVIDTVLPPEKEWTKNPSIKCLGRSIQMMADADYYIGVSDVSNFELRDCYTGCKIENEVATSKLNHENIFLIGYCHNIPIFHKAFYNMHEVCTDAKIN